jgi:hypothetical protein
LKLILQAKQIIFEFTSVEGNQLRFVDWIYYNKDLYLQSKYNEFMKEKLDISQLKDGIKTHRNALIKRNRA